jgi:hypothetical protein
MPANRGRRRSVFARHRIACRRGEEVHRDLAVGEELEEVLGERLRSSDEHREGSR